MLVSPADNARNQPTTVTLSWGAAARAASYRLQVARDSTFATLVVDSDTLRTTSFVLTGLSLNTVYFWRVSAANTGGSSSFSDIRRFTTILTTAIEVLAEGVPRVLALHQNYPNPFNHSTKLEFTLPEDGRVSLRIYDIVGREIAVLFDGEAQAGMLLRATFDASYFPSGTYLARLEFGGKQLIKKLLLVK